MQGKRDSNSHTRSSRFQIPNLVGNLLPVTPLKHIIYRHQCWIPTNVRISPRGFAVPCHRALDQLVSKTIIVRTYPLYPQGEFTSCVVQQLPSSTQKTILSIRLLWLYFFKMTIYITIRIFTRRRIVFWITKII